MKQHYCPTGKVKLEKLARTGLPSLILFPIGGVPTGRWCSWHALQITGEDNMLEVWPNFQAYIHGGVSFRPYRDQFRQFFPNDSISYQEIYNATEGYCRPGRF
ncbi:MAG: GH3 auxin-responsive promoter family protein [Saprospiraceae bacterium]